MCWYVWLDLGLTLRLSWVLMTTRQACHCWSLLRVLSCWYWLYRVLLWYFSRFWSTTGWSWHRRQGVGCAKHIRLPTSQAIVPAHRATKLLLVSISRSLCPSCRCLLLLLGNIHLHWIVLLILDQLVVLHDWNGFSFDQWVLVSVKATHVIICQLVIICVRQRNVHGESTISAHSVSACAFVWWTFSYSSCNLIVISKVSVFSFDAWSRFLSFHINEYIFDPPHLLLQ